MKLRVLTATKKGKLLSLAEIISKKGGAEYAVDVIPPAYPCERERLTVIVVSAAAKMPDSFSFFCKSLSRARSQYVAFVVDGTAENAEQIIAWVKEAGSRVCENVLYVNGGLPFKFLRGVSDEEKKNAEDWIDAVLAEISTAQA